MNANDIISLAGIIALGAMGIYFRIKSNKKSNI